MYTAATIKRSIDPASTVVVVPVYIAAIAVSEVVLVAMGAMAGIVCHAIIILALLNHYVWFDQARHRAILLVLALAPLLRILSVVMPIRALPHLYWYALIGLPLLIAAASTVRLLNVPVTALGLRRQPWQAQALIALSGLPLSVLAFLLVRPRPIIPSLDWRHVALATVILTVFVGFVEEFLFRGLLQYVAARIYRNGVVCSTSVFASMYIGTLSLPYIVLIGSVGLFFGWCVWRTGSLWGVVLAHSVLVIGMGCIWPFVWH